MTETEGFSFGIVQDKVHFPDPYQFFQVGKELGAASLEFKYETDLDERFSLRNVVAQKLGAQAKDLNMRLSVHAPYNEGINMGDPDPQIRARTREAFIQSLEYASRLGASYVTVHGGHVEIEPQTIPRRGSSTGSSHEHPPRLRPFVTAEVFNRLKSRTHKELSWLVTEAERRDLVIALENFHDYSNFKVRYPIIPEDFLEIFAEVGDRLQVNYDSGHGNSTGRQLLDFIQAVGPERVAGTHLHDNNQMADLHLPPLQGNVDFESFLQEYVRRGWMFPLNVEVKNLEDVRVSLNTLRHYVQYST